MEESLSYNIHQVSKKIKNGEISPVELIKSLFTRIDEVDSTLNTYITINHEQVLREAKEIEKEIKQGNYKGPLHGIPIGVKDNIYTKGIKTTMGSEIYKDFIPEDDAFVIDILKRGGAIIIGKHNTHQFTYGPTGDRSHAGPVRNPYDIKKMSGGSSSGSAASVAAYLCYGALGTDTSGSVRIPASFCGIVGMKPTFGSISSSGVYPLSWTLDHVGPMTRSVTDNALLLNATVAHDTKDPKSIKRDHEDYTRLLGKKIQGKKIGIPTTFYYEGVQEEIISAIEKVINVFVKLGAQITHVNLPHIERILEAQRVILRTEAYATHEENLREYPDLWDKEVKERLLTALDTKGFEYAKALQNREFAKQEFNHILKECDILITPTMSIMPPEVGGRYATNSQSDEDHIRWTITKLTSPTNLNGFPSLTIPCDFSKQGLPIGVQLIGKEFDEASLYQFGYALEQELSLNTIKDDLLFLKI